MRKKDKKKVLLKQEVPKQETPKEIIKKQEVPKQEIPKKQEIIEITDFNEANRLQKEGWIVTEVLSEIGGVRPKTWVLKK